jgi:hypothetical protein
MIKDLPLPEKDIVGALRYTQRFMLRKYGTQDVQLGDVQRMVRGNVSFPAGGMREVARAADPKSPSEYRFTTQSSPASEGVIGHSEQK